MSMLQARSNAASAKREKPMTALSAQLTLAQSAAKGRYPPIQQVAAFLNGHSIACR